MNIQLIQVPYDSGHKSLRTGRGPDHFLQHGLDRILRAAGHQVEISRIESQASVATEIGTAFELNRSIAAQVGSTVSGRALPIVLAGNCNSCVGTIAGALVGTGQDSLGIVWLDAHGDFNTPETTLTGFLDGMGLAMTTGRCWRSLAATIPGFKPIPEAHVVHIGAHDLDPEEARLLRASQIAVIAPDEDEGRFLRAAGAAFDKIKGIVTRVYLHVDLDVLDAGDAQANRLAVPGGLSVELVEELIGMLKERFELCAAAITSFDPAFDKNDIVLSASIRLIEAFVV